MHTLAFLSVGESSRLSVSAIEHESKTPLHIYGWLARVKIEQPLTNGLCLRDCCLFRTGPFPLYKIDASLCEFPVPIQKERDGCCAFLQQPFLLVLSSRCSRPGGSSLSFHPWRMAPTYQSGAGVSPCCVYWISMLLRISLQSRLFYCFSNHFTDICHLHSMPFRQHRRLSHLLSQVEELSWSCACQSFQALACCLLPGLKEPPAVEQAASAIR